MNCEEFELTGLDSRQSGASGDERAAAREHVQNCRRCAALADSWDEAKAELLLLSDRTREAEAPARVEMRLRQEFRMRRRPVIVMRRAAMIGAWALAAALLVVVGMKWKSWSSGGQELKAGGSPLERTIGTASEAKMLVADNDEGTFTRLPGSIAREAENTSVMQVRMQRGALGALGLQVDQDRVADWIEVDLLVGEDGTPEAVRLHQDTLQASAAVQ